MQEVRPMYSVVLMMAMTTGGGEAPALGRHGCHGCGGGCYGCGGGCYGGGGGGCHGRRRHGCHGCHGCGGGCSGCYGGCYGGGCYGGGCYGGGAAWAAPAGGAPVMQGGPVRGGGKPERIRKMPRSGLPLDATPATIVVSLPADARLSVDDVPTTSTSANRVFVSPPLPPGRDYHYALKAEVVRDGQPLTVTRQVRARAGETSRVTLAFPPTAVAAR
jgi:uncharacterized protein (TIGR03000 family)